MRVRQWQQLELEFDLTELIAVHGSPGSGPHPEPGGNPVDERCAQCGWPVDEQSVLACDVENCQFLPKSATGEPTTDR